MRYVMVDRDGVINEDSEAYIKSPQEWQAIPGSMEALSLLNKSGYLVVVITNQSGLGRGLYDQQTLSDIHEKMRRSVERAGGKIEAIYYCPHRPDHGCDCRKPKPGLLKTFARERKTNLKDVPFIGDTLRDVQAAVAVGAKPILVKTGKGKKTLADNPSMNTLVFENLYDAVQHIVSGE